ncbi:MAG: hypothetical protein O2816_00905 [Planctomycetota bacterium]|nr:hypothetical protein [Planctomycetota bacterium]
MLRRALSLCALLVACGTSSVESSQDPSEATFPEDWFGTWSGQVTETAASGDHVPGTRGFRPDVVRRAS